MKGKLHLIAGVLFAVALLYDLYLWGGLGHMRDAGPVAVEATQRELALASVYLPLGRAAVSAVGLEAAAAEFAGERFAPLVPRLLANRAAAMDTLIGGMPQGVSVGYYGAPLLLLAFAVLWWLRPRHVHVMGGR